MARACYTSSTLVWGKGRAVGASGAAREQRVQEWYMMRDPAGLLICVVPAPAGSPGASNAQRWE
jgi:hypothetical protein